MDRKSYLEEDTSLINSVQSHGNLPTKNLKRDRILVLVGGVCIHLVLGTFYLWGTISIYVASYLRSFDSSIDIEMLSGVFPLAAIGLNTGLLFSLSLAEKVGFRIVLFFGVFLMSATVFCTSFITTYIAFVLVYGVLMGICAGFVYMLPMVCGWKYFPDRKGLVSGLTIGAFGFGSFIFNFVVQQIVNPDNINPSLVDPVDKYKYFDSNVYENVPSMFRILAGCYLTLGMIGVFTIRVPPMTKKVVDVSESDSSQLLPSSQEGCRSVKEGLLSLPTLLLIIMACFGSFFGLFMSANFKVYGLTKISDDAFLTLVGSLGSVGNGTTRALWALLFDRFGFKRVYFVLIILQMALAASVGYISYSKPLYLIWYVLIMSCEGGHFSLFPSVTAKIFGLKFGPKIYSFIFWGFAVGNFAGFFVTKFGLDTIGWQSIFFMALGFSAVSFVCAIIFKERYQPKRN